MLNKTIGLSIFTLALIQSTQIFAAQGFSTQVVLNDSYQMKPSDQKALIKAIRSQWEKSGLNNAQASICQNNTCTHELNTEHVLNIQISPIEKGIVTQGISFTVEQSDPRQAYIHEESVLPVSCALKDVNQGKIINSDQHNTPAPDWLKNHKSMNAKHFASLLVKTCEDTVMNSGEKYAVAIKRQSKELLTPFPEVTIEKRIPEDTITDVTSAQKADKKVQQVTKIEKEERVQYVIKNPASEVILEFGQHR